MQPKRYELSRLQALVDSGHFRGRGDAGHALAALFEIAFIEGREHIGAHPPLEPDQCRKLRLFESAVRSQRKKGSASNAPDLPPRRETARP